jgi:CheY-like chemotaxis protein
MAARGCVAYCRALRVLPHRQLTFGRATCVACTLAKDDQMHGTPPFRSLSTPRLLALLSRISGRLSAKPTHPDAHATPAPHLTVPLRRSSLVLLAEDDAMQRLLTSEMLLSCGAQPHLAADGAEAVAAACTLRFDLILMDLQMPVLDGLEATKAIRHFEQTHFRPRTPVVAYTSCALSDIENVVYACGVDAVLEKPCALDQFRECLERWCAPAAVPSRGEVRTS